MVRPTRSATYRLMNEHRPRALVTGANKGIGREVARQLAVRGYTVWLGSRDDGRGREAAGVLASAGDVRFVRLDVTDARSVDQAAETVRAASGELDLLVNNAGIYLQADGSPSVVEVETVTRTYDVNVLGPLRVTRAFLPLLRAARDARIVMVGSGLGSLALQSDPTSGLGQWPVFAYASSKTALSALTVAFANELRSEGIVVTVVNPGYVATDLNDHAGTTTTEDGARMVLRALDVPLSRTGRFVDGDGTLPW